MVDDKFKLPGTSYDELVKIIGAYAALDREAPAAEVGNLIGKHETNISRNNGFLTAMAIIESAPKGKRVTPEGKSLGLAYQHNQSSEIAAQWRRLSEQSDFVQKILSAVRIRKGMDRPTLTSHIAYTAGQAKTKATMAGANCFIDILLTASLLSEENGKLTAVSPAQPTKSPDDEPRRKPTVEAVDTGPTGPALSYGGTETAFTTGLPYTQVTNYSGVTLEIRLHISVECTPDEIASLAPRIRQLVNDLQSPPGDVESPPEDAPAG